MSFEDDWIEGLARRFGKTVRGLRTGIGSDCAVLEDPPAPALVSTDTQVEGVHFDLRYMDWVDAGYRAVACALSDLAAGGVDPAYPLLVFLSVSIRSSMSSADREALADGLVEGVRAHGATLAGGDTVATSGPATITATVIGYAPRPLTRAGARAGEGVYVAGALGGAAAALRLLKSNAAQDNDKTLLAAYRRPVAMLNVGHRLAHGGATACADISDGLLRDASRIARQSGVTIGIDLERLPTHPALKTDPRFGVEERVRLAATFGDDYALVFTAPIAAETELAEAFFCVRVGACREGEPGIDATWRDSPYRPASDGYEH